MSIEGVSHVEFEGIASTPALAEYCYEQAIALEHLAAGMEACLIRVTRSHDAPGHRCRFHVRVVVKVGGATLDACQADENLFVALRFACLSMRCHIAEARRRLRRIRQVRTKAAGPRRPVPRT